MAVSPDLIAIGFQVAGAAALVWWAVWAIRTDLSLRKQLLGTTREHRVPIARAFGNRSALYLWAVCLLGFLGPLVGAVADDMLGRALPVVGVLIVLLVPVCFVSVHFYVYMSGLYSDR